MRFGLHKTDMAFKPMSNDSLRMRWKAARDHTYKLKTVSEITHQRERVMDTRSGFRMIATREQWKNGETWMHVSVQLINQSKMPAIATRGGDRDRLFKRWLRQQAPAVFSGIVGRDPVINTSWFEQYEFHWLETP